MSTTTLDSTLYSIFAKRIQEARKVAEEGARQALQRLAVDRARPFESMSDTEKALRKRLRGRGRDLRDKRNKETGKQEIWRLTHEVAYEHWHRMLFARFLVDNGLLVEPKSGVAISITECNEIAQAEGKDGWELASGFAQEMLPELFRQGDPSLEVKLAPEVRQELLQILNLLPEAVFRADDSLGWTYQFWQAEAKERANIKGDKIDADTLPAVTQLFTERYMVLFLLHNTIGAWRAGKVLAGRADLMRAVGSEEELRDAVAIESFDRFDRYDFTYLRFVDDCAEEEKVAPNWRPTAGTFEEWPEDASELRILDPCCGSGHFLVECFNLLVRMRVEEEDLSLIRAIEAVINENIFGLEVDQRCAQIASFNLILTAWRLAGKPILSLDPSIACCGAKPQATALEWTQLAEKAGNLGGKLTEGKIFGTERSLISQKVREGIIRLNSLFEDAPELGSLINPRSLESDLFSGGFNAVEAFLPAVIKHERSKVHVGRDYERAIAAQGMARAAELLMKSYTLVITNVPYLGRGKQSEKVRSFCKKYHSEAKGDLATVFVSRAFDRWLDETGTFEGWLGESGTQAVVVPQNCLFLSSYTEFRKYLLRNHRWKLIAKLGEGAFRNKQAAGAFVALGILSAGKPSPNQKMTVMSVATNPGKPRTTPKKKAEGIKNTGIYISEQKDQLSNPDSIIMIRPIGDQQLLNAYSSAFAGISTGDSPRYRCGFWELDEVGTDCDWQFLQSTGGTDEFGGRRLVVLWQQGQGNMHRIDSSRICGKSAWSHQGVSISCMRALPVTRYTGELFDTSASALVPASKESLPAIWAYCSSPEYSENVRELDAKLMVTTATLAKVPVDLPRWQKVAEQDYPKGLPEPYSNDPTQWVFHGHPCGNVFWDTKKKKTAVGPPRIEASVLQVAVARLMGYRWPAEKDPKMPLAPEMREVLDRCPEIHKFSDSDGIVCLPPVRGEPPADVRLREVLAAAYGDAWTTTTERQLLDVTTDSDRKPKSLANWLRDAFFREHCKQFLQRPFIWHIWDGRKDGFHVLVNYHRLVASDGAGKRTLESLTYAYLGDWIERQRADMANEIPGADSRLAAALGLKGQLEGILQGEPPYDIFVRWRPLREQPLGWTPKMDDGVRINIRPFIYAQLPSGGRKGAGILAHKPNIKWNKDNGKEPTHAKGDSHTHLRPPDQFPWFYGCPGDGRVDSRTDYLADDSADFDGNRWNNLHYSHKVKKGSGVP